MSVKRAQEEIDSHEFSEWCAFRRLRHVPDDIRTARVCLVMARVNGNDKAQLDDFLPYLPRRPMSGKELKARMQGLVREHEKTLERKKSRDKRKAARK